jgi:hypothetical protein
MGRGTVEPQVSQNVTGCPNAIGGTGTIDAIVTGSSTDVTGASFALSRTTSAEKANR